MNCSISKISGIKIPAISQYTNFGKTFLIFKLKVEPKKSASLSNSTHYISWAKKT